MIVRGRLVGNVVRGLFVFGLAVGMESRLTQPGLLLGSIDYMAPASFYEKIGVQTGDVLQRVNGVDIRDPSTILNLLQQLKNEQVVKLDIVRNDQRSTITYELR